MLYLDILGFSDAVENNDEIIEKIFSYLDSNNFLQKHSFMSRIIFSDTVLFFNTKELPLGSPNIVNVVGDMLELCQLLIWNFIPYNVFFRGVITYGPFNHKRHENSEYFYGKALIDAFKVEKQLPLTGIIIDKTLQEYNIYYKSCELNNRFDYVYLTNFLIRAAFQDKNKMQLVVESDTGEAEGVYKEVEFLKQVYQNMSNHPDLNIRAKHALTWLLYKKYLANILDDMEKCNFDLKTLHPSINWESEVKDFKHYD